MSEKKSTFSQTCNRLREYAKEKRSSMVDLSLAMPLSHESYTDIEQLPSPKPSVVNLFPTERSMPQNMSMPRRDASLHQQLGFGPISHAENKSNMADDDRCNSLLSCPTNRRQTSGCFYEQGGNIYNSAGTGSWKGAQMTIVYAGQVMVYDDIAVDEAKEIMHFAGTNDTFSFRPFASHSNINRNPSRKSVLLPHGHTVVDLPIKRKASLTRFFEKRKDRIKARASAYSASNSITNADDE